MKDSFESERKSLYRSVERSYKQQFETLENKERDIKNKESKLDKIIESTVLSRLSSGIEKSQLRLQEYPIFSDFSNYSHTRNLRLAKALGEPMKFIGPLATNCKIRGSQEHIYDVSLTSCTCTDFLHTHQPCKHMYRLAIELSLLANQETIEASVSQAASLLDTEISTRKRMLSQLEREHHIQDRSLARLKEQKKELLKDCRRLLSEKSLTHPWAATQFADLMYARDMDVVESLRYKKNPATKAADKVAAISTELRKYRELAKSLQYRLQVYETAVPWLEDYTDISPAELVALATSDDSSSEDTDEYDRLRNWLSPQEYSSLPNYEKYQLALERWKKRKKSNWEAGRDFERYVGYLYESQGYTVTYCGALEGLNDLGRDLIAKNGFEVLIIQCKRWKEQRTIHEKHIFQLYGSVVSYNIENFGHATSIGDIGRSSIGVLATTCPISDTARQFADYLRIKIDDSYKSSEVFDYPMIKCNISKTGECIYHLPFDQQYDRVKISQEKGEFFAHTVQEAENAGFRRAFRWHSS